MFIELIINMLNLVLKYWFGERFVHIPRRWNKNNALGSLAEGLFFCIFKSSCEVNWQLEVSVVLDI
jgi:hypothetical protein